MLKPEITPNGELKIHVCMLIPILPVFAALYALSTFSAVQESALDRICSLPLLNHSNQWERDHAALSSPRFKVAQHPGCSAEPVYTSRDACPTCFRPVVTREFTDEQFLPVPNETYMSPRGPRGYFKPAATRQQNFTSGALITPRGMCVENCPYLVALVLSMLHESNTRDSIRAAWASVAKTNFWPDGARVNARVAVIFVVAWSHPYHGKEGSGHGGVVKNVLQKLNYLKSLEAEANLYNDILMLDMDDVYSSLTLKVASAMSWAVEHCSRSKFFLKIDQDTFLNVPLLLDILIYHEKRLETSVTGHIYTTTRHVDRRGRWGVSKKIFPMSEYPVFSAGCAYVVSRQAALRILALFPYFPFMGIEDAFLTGVLGKVAGVRHFSPGHNSYFTEFFHYVTNWCSFLQDQLVTGTGFALKERRLNLWASFIANDWQCKKGGIGGCRDEFVPKIRV